MIFKPKMKEEDGREELKRSSAYSVQ